MDKLVILLLTLLVRFGCEAEKCPELTQPHASECNKYLKCVELPSDIVSWVTMRCQTGLVYDKNLRSCAIPGDNWECMLDSQNDENNVETDNLEYSGAAHDDNNEFLEVIEGNFGFFEGRSDEDGASGDGELTSTPSAPTVRMITTQLQRLTQLIKHEEDKKNGLVDEDIGPDDLNSFLAVQKIQSDSPDYQKNDFNSEKTPIPSNGRIHPEILTNILDQQNQLNQLTTLSMDATTSAPAKPARRKPIKEIKLKNGLQTDLASHKIVIRPEGSVMFNMPSAQSDHQTQSPYLSADVLKTLLEISRQMVVQKQNQNSYAPQPFYYAVPIPVITPQNSYYNQDYGLNITESPTHVVAKKKLKPAKSSISSFQLKDGYVEDGFDDYKNLNPFPNNPPRYPQNPSYYYNNYPSYGNDYSVGNFQQFPPNTYQYPSHNQYNQQFSNFDSAAYYGNRPFVIEPSAPSYVDHSLRQKPFLKESYLEESDEDNFENDEIEAESEEEKPEKDKLICSPVIQRQANTTDCFKYYVCNSKTKEVLSYTCPLFTAFNDQTKFCDSQSYAACKKAKERSDNIYQNKKIYNQAQAALQQVKKESQKVERIASMVQKESEKIYKHRNQYQQQNQDEVSDYYATNFEKLQMAQRPLIARIQPSTPPPIMTKRPKPSQEGIKKKKKKKVKCRDNIGNIVDPESRNSYWHCFRGSDGRMKRINRKCSQNFVFCPSTHYCTSASRCQFH